MRKQRRLREGGSWLTAVRFVRSLPLREVAARAHAFKARDSYTLTSATCAIRYFEPTEWTALLQAMRLWDPTVSPTRQP